MNELRFYNWVMTLRRIIKVSEEQADRMYIQVLSLKAIE